MVDSTVKIDDNGYVNGFGYIDRIDNEVNFLKTMNQIVVF